MRIVRFAGFLLLLTVAVSCCCQNRRINKVEHEICVARVSGGGMASPISFGAPFNFGRYQLFNVKSLYAKDGERWLPVYCVEEVTTNRPPCRSIDRTGMWYAPVGGVDPGKLRDKYVPPRPLWEVP